MLVRYPSTEEDGKNREANLVYDDGFGLVRVKFLDPVAPYE
jgi:hypothetical protein